MSTRDESNPQNTKVLDEKSPLLDQHFLRTNGSKKNKSEKEIEIMEEKNQRRWRRSIFSLSCLSLCYLPQIKIIKNIKTRANTFKSRERRKKCLVNKTKNSAELLLLLQWTHLEIQIEKTVLESFSISPGNKGNTSGLGLCFSWNVKRKKMRVSRDSLKTLKFESENTFKV